VCNLEGTRGAGGNFSQKVAPGKLPTTSGSLQPAPVESRKVWYREYKQLVASETRFKRMVFRNR